MSTFEQKHSLQLPDLLSGEVKNYFEKRLMMEWLTILEQNKVSEIRQPIINKERLLELIITAQRTQQPLVFVAIGCQDWIKPEWGDPRKDRIMGKISPEDKRVRRFVNEMSSFSQALSSFEVPHRIHFSLSDIEALIHIELHNMGLVIHDPDKSRLELYVINLATSIQLNGGVVEPFIHSKILQKLFQFPTLQGYQEFLTGQSDPSYRDFLDREYVVDLSLVANYFVRPNELGPVWLDIQSFNFEDDVISFEKMAQETNPEMPILSIMPNAGNWHGRTKPQGIFPQRSEILSLLIGLNQQPKGEEDWSRKLSKAKNEPLQQLISGIMEKVFAVRLVSLLAFGIDPMLKESRENE